MRQLNYIFMITILIFSSMSLISESTCHAGKKRIKLATLAPEGSIWLKQIDLLNQDLEKETHGAIQFKIYPGGIMGDDDVVMRKMRVGQLDGALFTTGALAKINKDLQTIAFPGLFDSYEDVDQFLETDGKVFNELLQPKGYQVLGVLSLGFTYMFSQKDINSFDEFKAARGWLWDADRVMKTLYDESGITPVSVGISDVMTALQTGLLDTVFNTPTGVLSMQWFTRVTNMLDVPLTHAFGAVILSEKSWKKIPGDMQPIVTRLVQKHSAEITRKTRLEDEKAKEVLQTRGIKITTANPELKGKLDNVFKKSVDSLLKQGIDSELYNTISKKNIQ